MVQITYGDRICKQGKLTVGCAAAVFDKSKQKILLIRREDNTGWAVPGGYMESGESVTEGCEREVFEETGLHVKVQRLIGVYSNPNMLVEYPDGNRWQIVILYFLAETIGGELQAGDDALDAGYFSLEEIEHMKVRALDRQRIADVFADQKVAFIRDDIYI